MQSSSDLDSQVKILFSKSNESKPYGFTLISETDDGTPAFFVGKTEVAARNQAKEELKKAKKKKMVIGLAFIKDKKLVLLPGSKPIQVALVSKAFKKLKNKTKKYKGIFAKTPEVLTAAPKDDMADLDAESGKALKYMSVLQNRQAQYQDLEGIYQDAQLSFSRVISLISEKNDSILEIENNLQSLFKKVESIKPLLHEAEKLILSEADKSDIKTSLKTLKEVLTTYTQEAENLTVTIQGLSIDGNENEDNSLEVGSIVWILKQAQNLQVKMNDYISSSQENVIQKEKEEMDALVVVLESLAEKEKTEVGVSTKEEETQEKKLQELNQKYMSALVNAQMKDMSKPLGERAQSIWASAYSKAEMNILQFQSAVLSNPTILNDFRFPAIQKHIFSLNLTALPQANFAGITKSKKLAAAVAKYEKDNKTELEKWKKVDKKSPFGGFSIYAHISNAFKQILKMKK